MINRDFFNSAAKWGLLLGVLMGASRIYESAALISGDMTKFTMMSLEWLISVGVYFGLLYLANKRRAAEMPAELGYPMRQVLNYSIMISIFAAIIIGISSHIYVANVIGGYGEYVERSMASIVKIMEQVDISTDMQELYDASAESVREVVENPPNIFSTVTSMVANYIISGFVLGLIVALFTRKRAEIKVEEEGGSNE